MSSSVYLNPSCTVVTEYISFLLYRVHSVAECRGSSTGRDIGVSSGTRLSFVYQLQQDVSFAFQRNILVKCQERLNHDQTFDFFDMFFVSAFF